MEYAKFIDENTIQRPRKHLKTPLLVAFNFDKNEELLRQEGYCPLVELNQPEDVQDDTHYAKPTYQYIEAIANDVDGSYIAVTYTQVPIVAEEE